MAGKTYCPVGCCHPLTARSLEVPEQGQLCKRHWGKLSPPMQRQIQSARARAKGPADLAGIMAQAVKEARRLDEYWYPWSVVDGSRVERFDRWDKAVHRWAALREGERQPVIISGVAGAERSTDWILARCPWEVHDSSHAIVLGQSDSAGRPPGWTPLVWALTRAHDDHCFDRKTKRTRWPNGEQAIGDQACTRARMPGHRVGRHVAAVLGFGATARPCRGSRLCSGGCPVLTKWEMAQTFAMAIMLARLDRRTRARVIVWWIDALEVAP